MPLHIGITASHISYCIIKTKNHAVQLFIATIQNGKLDRIIDIGFSPGDNLDLCSSPCAQIHIADSPNVSCVRISGTHDFAELLLKEIHSLPQIPMMPQMYRGAVIVNTRQANRMAGPAHSNWPCLR